MDQDIDAKIKELEEEYFDLLQPYTNGRYRWRPHIGRSKEEEQCTYKLTKQLLYLPLPHYFVWCFIGTVLSEKSPLFS